MKKYNTFNEFYPFYLSEHMNPICRALHFIGTLGVIILITSSYYNYNFIFLAPICGYSFAWIGHFVFEKNKPATFTYPLYSFLADWAMFKDIIIGKESMIKPKKNY